LQAAGQILALRPIHTPSLLSSGGSPAGPLKGTAF
jgi:hypothetical protein